MDLAFLDLAACHTVLNKCVQQVGELSGIDDYAQKTCPNVVVLIRDQLTAAAQRQSKQQKHYRQQPLGYHVVCLLISI
jgi:hypothetical protein